MSEIEELTYADLMPRVTELAEDLLGHSDVTVRHQVEELVDLIDAFHLEGVGRLVEFTRKWRGETFLKSAAEDEIIGTFLRSYDLGEVVDERDTKLVEEAIDAALDEMRPFVESHGGTITVETIQDGVVSVNMLGSCDGCPSSSSTLTGGVEEALRRHWPNFRRLEVIDPDADSAPAPASVGASAAAAPEPAPALLQIGRKPASS